MQPATKKSKQRDAIIKFLMTRKDHPTADMVYMNIKEEFPKISLGTVYRNLALLSERGEILSYLTKEEQTITMHAPIHTIILCVRNVEQSSIWRWHRSMRS